MAGRMKEWAVTALLCAVSVTISASAPTSLSVFKGRLERAFAALEVHNYFKARELFLKEAKRHPAAAWYGVSVITGRADNPFYQLDSSFAAIIRSDSAFRLTSLKQRDRIAALGVDTAAIHAQEKHIYGIAWKQVGHIDRIADYQHFISTYTASSHVADAVKRRDELAFREARTLNTSAGYHAFLQRYPDAEQAFEARSRLQEAVFRESTPKGTIAEYQRFIATHPDSPYLRAAQDGLLDLNVPHHTAGEYAAFIRRYPKNPNVNKAWRSIYALYTKDLTVKNITQFIKDYPDYPFINELMDDYDAASLVLLPFRQNGKWGYIDDKGVDRIKAVFEFAEPFARSQAQVGQNGHVGTINKLGKPVVPIAYDNVTEYKEGLATVELAGRQGVVDRNGKLVVPMEYKEIGEFDQGLADASKDGHYGYIDAGGKVVIPFDYAGAMPFHNGLAVVIKDGHSGVIDTKGDVVVPCQYDWIEGFHGRFSRVRKDGHMGIISIFGDVVLPVEHDHVGSFNDSLALVIDKGKCGYVNTRGAWAIPRQFGADALTINRGDFHNGVARVLSHGKLGLINTKGDMIFPAQYADIGLMEGGIVPVKKRSKWGYASRSFNTVAEAKYDQAWEMYEGYARVEVGGLFGVIDSTGKEVIAPTYSALGDLDHGLFTATSEKGTGVVSVSGKVLVPLDFDKVSQAGNGLIKVIEGDKFAYMRIPGGGYLWKEQGFGRRSAK